MATTVSSVLSLVAACCYGTYAGVHVVRSPRLDQYLELGEPVTVLAADSRLACAQSCAAVTGCTASMWIANRCNLYAAYERTNTRMLCKVVMTRSESGSKVFYGYKKVKVSSPLQFVHNTCTECGVEPVSIMNAEGNDKLAKFIQTQHVKSTCKNVWTGAVWKRDSGSWSWHPSGEAVNYTRWSAGEPSTPAAGTNKGGMVITLPGMEWEFRHPIPGGHPDLYPDSTYCAFCQITEP